MIGHYDMSMDDYLAILRRRRWLLLVPLVLGPVLGYGVAKLIPAQYTSTTLVLVEQQKVPVSFVQPVINDMLNQRLMTMQEQILSRSRLQPIIEKFGLFKEGAENRPMEELVARLRNSIVVTPIRPVVRARDAEYPGFFISYTGADAKTAQQVCSEITSEFMKENVVHREKAAAGTTEFLEKQVGEAKQKLDEKDKTLAVFKQTYIGQLPGQEQGNWNLLMSKTGQLEAATQAVSRGQQDKAYIEAMLAQQVAAWEATKSGQNPLTLEQQLASQEEALISLEARYTADHPDVIKARNDVMALRRRIAGAHDSEKAAQKKSDSVGPVTEPAQIQQLRAQVHQVEQLIKEKTRDQEVLQKDIRVLQARVQLSPVVEQQYKELTRDYETALGSYNDLLRKKTQSEIAGDLERRQQGEQFRVIDPANLPARPSFPDPLLFSGGGLGAGLAIGMGLILLLESRDRALRTERDIEVLLGLPTLAVIPILQESKAGKGKGWFGFWKKPQTAKGLTA